MENMVTQESLGKRVLIMLRNLAIVIGAFFIIIYSVVYVALYLTKISPSFSEWFYSNLVSYIIVNDILALIAFYFIAKRLGKEVRKKAFNFSKIHPKGIVVIALTGIVMGLFTHALCKIPFVQENYPQLNGILDSLVNAKNILIFIIFLLFNSAYKEVLFRGLLYNELKKVLPVGVSIVLQGALYGLLFFRGDVILGLYGLLGAVFFVYLYKWYGTLLAPYVAQVATTGALYLYVRIIDKYITVSSIKFILPITMILSGVLIYIIRKNKDNWSLKTQKEGVQLEG